MIIKVRTITGSSHVPYIMFVSLIIKIVLPLSRLTDTKRGSVFFFGRLNIFKFYNNCVKKIHVITVLFIE